MIMFLSAFKWQIVYTFFLMFWGLWVSLSFWLSNNLERSFADPQTTQSIARTEDCSPQTDPVVPLLRTMNM